MRGVPSSKAASHRTLLAAGFEQLRSRGSHRVGLRVTIPSHGNMTLHPKIVRQTLDIIDESRKSPMPIPDFQSLMLPVLRITSDGADHAVADIRSRITTSLNLTPEELAQKLKNGNGLFANRVAWAIAYLNKAQLVRLAARGVYRITDRGRLVLNENPPAISVRTLKQFPEFTSSRLSESPAGNDHTMPSATIDSPLPDEKQTPDELLDRSFQAHRNALESELLQVLKDCAPGAFEQIVIDLLLAMGYGGSDAEAGEVVGRSGDGGIDGVIKEDKLGLDVVYVQAKRWQNVVGSPEIMKFSGGLTRQYASKGVFITTSWFSKDALDYVKGIPQKIVLVDGKQLASFMIDYKVGVKETKSYVLKRVDQDYFENLES